MIKILGLILFAFLGFAAWNANLTHVSNNYKTIEPLTQYEYYQNSSQQERSYPVDYFSGYLNILGRFDARSDSNATAFSVSSSRGIWMTAAHSVNSCNSVLIEINSLEWGVVDKIVIDTDADQALLFTNFSAPAFPVASSKAWIPQQVYGLGYSKGEMNGGIFAAKGWTKTLDTDTESFFDTLVWVKTVFMDDTRIHGMSGGPMLDKFGRVVGIISSYNAKDMIGSVPPTLITPFLEAYGLNTENISVPSESDLTSSGLAKLMSSSQSSGSVKTIKCIRRSIEIPVVYE